MQTQPWPETRAVELVRRSDESFHYVGLLTVCVSVFGKMGYEIGLVFSLRQLTVPCSVGLWESLEVEAKTWMRGCTSQQPLLCSAHSLSERWRAPKSIPVTTPAPTPPPLKSPPPLFQLGNWIVLECSVPLFSGTWMVSLVFHTKVSFRVRGQATKTASSGGLGPINIFVHKGLWQLNNLQGDPHCRCMLSQGTTALELK